MSPGVAHCLVGCMVLWLMVVDSASGLLVLCVSFGGGF
nr:MAG TPA: hypothetical protein [Caudoviricetes sp.]